jgi:hypothetical protein
LPTPPLLFMREIIMKYLKPSFLLAVFHEYRI